MLGGPQGRSERVRKISPRTVQSVASRYTDGALPAPPTTDYYPSVLIIDYYRR